MNDWGQRNLRRLIELVNAAHAVQDVHSNHDSTVPAMHQTFPGSRFTLWVGDDAREWQEPLLSFNEEQPGSNGL